MRYLLDTNIISDMPKHKELADFLGITESGVKYKKKNKPAEYLLLSLGYKYLNQMSDFDRGHIMIRLSNNINALKKKRK